MTVGTSDQTFYAGKIDKDSVILYVDPYFAQCIFITLTMLTWFRGHIVVFFYLARDGDKEIWMKVVQRFVYPILV